VSDVFRERVFDSIPSVVMTSATLSDGSGKGSAFAFLQDRLGLSGGEHAPRELVVSSPFSYESQALLYVPDDLPVPNDARFAEASLERIVELVELTDGGAFVLSTSVRAMRALHRGLSSRLSRRLLVQGEGPKATLLSTFRAAGDAVLVATMSFWQGVDVPGRSLRLVVLDKIPFVVPTDPIVQARAESLESAGKNPFMELHVPLAEIALKQGFGRLIRSRDDFGVVALLDGRVLKRGYGRRLLAGLPPARRVTALEDVRAFWRERKLDPSSDPRVLAAPG
jgi:ATP-dependent DNA helicase DinG